LIGNFSLYPEPKWDWDGIDGTFTAIADSTHGAWSSGGQLVLVPYRRDDQLTCSGPKNKREAKENWKFRRDSTDTPMECRPVAVAGVPEVHLGFEWQDDTKLKLTLQGETSKSVLHLAAQTGATRIQLRISGEPVTFQSDNGHWFLVIPGKRAEKLPATVAMDALGENTEPQVVWKWSSGSTLVDKNSSPLTQENMGRVQSQPVRIRFNHAVPRGLRFGGKWEVSSVGDHGKLAAFKTDKEEVTYATLFSELANQPQFSGEGFNPTVTRDGWVSTPMRCFAIMTTRREVKEAVGIRNSFPPFGPIEPLVVGDGKRPTNVYRRTAEGYDIDRDPRLRAGYFPVNTLSPDNLWLFTKSESADEVVSGIFNVAVAVDGGSWVQHATLPVGDHIVCWNGFIDRVTVTSVQWKGETRFIAKFSKGFEITDTFWFVAPFLGVSTTGASEFWGIPNSALGARLTRVDAARQEELDIDLEWEVQSGGWVEVDFVNNTAEDLLPSFVEMETSKCLVLIDGTDSASSCGPILEVRNGSRFPIVVGWLATTSRGIQLNRLQVTLGGAEAEWTRLPYQTAPASIEDVGHRSAYEQALASPNTNEGAIDGVRWIRVGKEVRVCRAGTRGNGFYVYTPKS
jgi:hypothetical protein